MDDNRLAQIHLGIGVGTLSIAIRGGGGWAMWVLIGFSTLFTVSAILLWTKLELVKKLLRRASVDFLPLFLGLVLLGLAVLEKVSLTLGIIVEVAAFLYLYIRIYKRIVQYPQRDPVFSVIHLSSPRGAEITCHRVLTVPPLWTKLKF